MFMQDKLQNTRWVILKIAVAAAVGVAIWRVVVR